MRRYGMYMASMHTKRKIEHFKVSKYNMKALTWSTLMDCTTRTDGTTDGVVYPGKNLLLVSLVMQNEADSFRFSSFPGQCSSKYIKYIFTTIRIKPWVLSIVCICAAIT